MTAKTQLTRRGFIGASAALTALIATGAPVLAQSADSLTIAYDAGASMPEITTAYDSELGGMRVLVDGEVVAVVTGLNELDPDQITLTALSGGV